MRIPHIRDYTGQRVHMVGIGGSSMSGLADMLRHKGYQVSGSDRTDSYATRRLRELGIPVIVGHSAQNVDGAALVVYSAAIDPSNPERAACDALGIPTLERAYLLGQLMEGYSRAIGVCGAHGKTTTTSMLAQVLLDTGFDPTIHIGGRLDAIGGSTRIGQGDTFLAEACEFNASFLQLRPTMAVLLNIDADHLDYYRDIEHIQETFAQFLALLPQDGLCVGCGDDERVLALMHGLRCPGVTYGFAPHNRWQPVNLVYDEAGYPTFDAALDGRVLAHVVLRVPGGFQVLNALAALAAAYAAGADMARAGQALSDFAGVHRRFELTGIVQGVRLYHDYGHNPAEMANVLSVARLQRHNRLWAVMQPHTYSRVKRLFGDYIHCCDAADEVLITDIYAAREKDPGDIHSTMLVDRIAATGKSVHYTPTFDDTEAYLRAHWQPGDLVLTMGCGDINLLNEQLQAHENQA
ncbi:MAG: UDP-N-acetylmuramate--L-alanine ligase [Oscillospiraceae bacterium]|jgi:UDP-N-acetylmuramate--alanine ligase|nr:UDP-N-acetylmuramate--L-alanine ligase [Oscillospiraceae bacterium]